ncbi:ISAs1 family transposase [uncultured Microbulbifer sp.]|uniref:ISAs1 family transposase n=1 Tax=uncultured Microbulbifer sp. TaxID=348147 RepID=UPI00262CDEA0|nr:ISAs1 family transposase [uncultured Microbulbifer sp.]
MCGANTMVEVCEFAEANLEWLQSFLDLKNDISSHNTFERGFAKINPTFFEECFRNWINSLDLSQDGPLKKVIAIDGKTSRGSGCQTKKVKPIHTVAAWASSHRIMLDQVKTEEKSNEMTAVPKLLGKIDIEGSIVTLDAMGCQTKIQQQIINQHADYVVNVKGNQGSLEKEIKALFAHGDSIQYKKIYNRHKIEKVRGRSRMETRKYSLIRLRDCPEFEHRWPGLRSIGRLIVKRTENHKTTESVRYFITSLAYDDIDNFMHSARKHWDIEINLHWSLDVAFREDANRMRVGFSAENIELIRRIALNLLKQEATHKRGIESRRKRAEWDRDYLWKVLTADQAIIKQAN